MEMGGALHRWRQTLSFCARLIGHPNVLRQRDGSILRIYDLISRFQHEKSFDWSTSEEKLHCPVGWSVKINSASQATKIFAEPQHISPETVSIQLKWRGTIKPALAIGSAEDQLIIELEKAKGLGEQPDFDSELVVRIPDRFCGLDITTHGVPSSQISYETV
eukprot:jgi/Botrbrau1/10373/Bobra.146_2s0011.1